MGRKIENPLKEGILSKIWFLCYAEPGITTTRLAAKIFGEDKKHFSGRISEYLKRLMPDYIEDLGVRAGYKAKSEPLLKEIEKELEKENIELTLSEKEILKQFLDRDLRLALEKEKITEKRYIFEGSLNAFLFLCDWIAGIASLTLLPEGEKAFKEYFGVTPTKLPESLAQKLMKLPSQSPCVHKIEEIAKFAYDMYNVGLNEGYIKALEVIREALEKGYQINKNVIEECIKHAKEKPNCLINLSL